MGSINTQANSQALAEMATVMVGTVMRASGIVQQGDARAAELEFGASQFDVLAGQERASSQRAAQEERRQGKLRSSRALAVAAASGGGTGGTVENIISDLDAETAFRANTALFQGESKARFLESQAIANRFGGQQAKRASRIAAFGTIFSGTGSLFGKYGDLFKTPTSGLGRFEENPTFTNPSF